MSEPFGNGDGDVVLERDPKTARARRYCVVFYNDDYTTKWFVVHVLEQFFRMTETSATALMMAIHEHGKGVAGTYTRDIAETKATLMMDYAEEVQMPLKVTAEPVAWRRGLRRVGRRRRYRRGRYGLASRDTAVASRAACQHLRACNCRRLRA